MGIRHYTLTLSGAVQRLSSVLANTSVGGPQDEAFRYITVQIGKAGTTEVYIGGPTVSTTDYGIRMDPADTAEPFSIGSYEAGAIKLSEIYVIGTANDLLHIFGIPF